MIRKVSALLFFACIGFGAHAQGGMVEPERGDAFLRQCSTWGGRSVVLFEWERTMGEYVRFPGSIEDETGRVDGMFGTYQPVRLGLLTEPDGRTSTLDFITPTAWPIDFWPGGEGMSRKVNRGRLGGLPRDGRLISVDCPETAERGERPDDAKAAPKSIGDIAKRFEKPAPEEAPAPSLAARVGGEPNPAKGSGEPAAGAVEGALKEAAKAPNPSKIASKPAAGAKPDIAAKEAVRPAAPASVRPGEGAENLLRWGAGTRRDAICNLAAAGLKPLTFAGVDKPASLLTVGIRNSEWTAPGFDFEATANDAAPRNVDYAIPGRLGELVAFDAVARKDADTQWVSIQGAEERTKRDRAPPTTLIRIVVVAGAPELANSGLDAVGKELKKQSGRVKVNAIWYAVDENGALASPAEFQSLQELVKAAKEKGGGRRPAVFDEIQILDLFDRFETVLKEQTQPADKVFWVKGAFPIPSSFPQRFEKFLKQVAASRALVRNPLGPPSNWMIVVTARMAGFTNNYLKAPLVEHGDGDVIEETTDGRSDGRYIADAAMLATKLRTGVLSTSAIAPAPADNGLDQKLVFSDQEVFAQRGYLLAPEVAEKLAAHLQEVLKLWSGDRLDKNALTKLPEKTGIPNAALTNLLQGSNGTSYPRLSKTLPIWARTPLLVLEKAPDPSGSREAKKFVEKYAAGAAKVVRVLKDSADEGEPACSMYYVPEEMLFSATLSTATGAK